MKLKKLMNNEINNEINRSLTKFPVNPSPPNRGRREFNFYFHILSHIKRFYEGLKGLLRHHKEV